MSGWSADGAMTRSGGDLAINPPFWRRADVWAAAVLALLFAALFVRWQILDRAPPEWDEAMYLLDGLGEYQGAKSGGLTGFYHAFLSTNPGRVGLLALLAQPGFWLFGPSADAAIAPFALLCVLAVWAFHDFTYQVGRHGLKLGDREAGLAGIAAAILFILYPATGYQSNKYLAEFPLIVSVGVLNAAAMRYFLRGGVTWALAIGLAITAGFLAKITFPALAIIAAVLVLCRWWSDRNWRRIVVEALAILLPPLVIVGPFLVRNFGAIVEQTRFLASAQLAGLYGFGGAMDLATSVNFLFGLAHQYEFLLLNLLAAAALVLGTARRPASATWLALLAAGYLVPLLIVAFSNFKIERYAYPGEGPLFCLAGLGLAALCAGRRAWGYVALLLLAIVPTIKFAVANHLVPARAAVLVEWSHRYANINERYSILRFEPTARGDVPALVREVNQAVGPGPVILLGGAPDFHGALLTFESRLQGVDRIFTTFSSITTQGPDAQREMLAFVKAVAPAALLYKTPPYEPAFLGRLVPETVQKLTEGGGYRAIDLAVSQPNGSQFKLLVPGSGTDTQPPVETAATSQLRYGASYESTVPRFARDDGQLVVTMTFRRTGPPIRAEAVFFHVLDASGAIIGNLDRPFCQSCGDPAKVQLREQRFVIPDSMLDRARQIGFGVYSAEPGSVPLPTQGGPSDWDGRRQIMSIPEMPK